MPHKTENANVNDFPIKDLKPFDRFKRDTWKFHTFVYVKKEGLTHFYRAEMTNIGYETTNDEMKVTIIR